MAYSMEYLTQHYESMRIMCDQDCGQRWGPKGRIILNMLDRSLTTGLGGLSFQPPCTESAGS